jgi:triosephosphate isomerase
MAKRKRLIAGNWKMYKGIEEARDLALAIAKGLPPGDDPDVILFPAFPCIPTVVAAVRGCAHPIGVGAQNLHPEPEGAFTGEVSGLMIRSTGAGSVIVGHSERRHIFGESDEFVGKKVRAALDLGITPILCVGEKIEEREAGKTFEVVGRQLKAGLDRLDPAKVSRTVIAYEPVWAIGTGKTATPQQGAEVHAFIRSEVAKLASPAVADGLRILYGGSVKPANIAGLLDQPDIDGALVGGASLEAASFLALCAFGNAASGCGAGGNAASGCGAGGNAASGCGAPGATQPKGGK